MLSRANSVGWMGEREEGDSSLSWHHNPCNNVVVVDNSTTNDNNNIINNNDDVSFKSLLDVQNEWYNYNNNTITNTSNINVNHQNSINFSTTNVTNCSENLLINPIDSSSCTPSPSVFNSTQTPFFFPSKTHLFNNPLPQSFVLGKRFFPETQPHGGLVLGDGFTEFSPQNEMGSPNLVNNPQFSTTHLVQLNENEGFNTGFGSRFRGFDEGLGNSMFVNRGSKLLKPLDNSAPPVGAQPTLFQKRAALRKSVASGSEGENTNDIINNNKSVGKFNNSCGENDKKRKFGNMGILDNVSFDGSAFNYDSDDFTENHNFSEGANNGGANSNNNSTVTGGGGGGGGTGGGDDCKGKKKGLPAKNLMAERRRRKKLNDRLYMLRSVVPKISKMDRASILGDAIEYLKELLQKINDLHNELESTPPPLTQTANFHPLTPTLPNLPSRIKEELCPSSLQSPNGQPARIEVRLREGRAVNIHMFCGRRPGLLLSTMRAIDGLGLDIQQAVISCFNGFAMDIFRAEQCKDGQDLHPEQIKALLLELATFPGSTVSSNCNI